jgi:2-methylcitrate dehydratase PrpD
MKEEQVRATVTLTDGRRLEKFIEHVVGSVERPMTDADLEAKFAGLADGVLPAAQARTLMDLCWKIDTLPNAAQVAAAARVG